MKKILFIAISLLCVSNIKARPIVDVQSIEDTISIGLITCDPGQQLYSLFGHTAIRVKDLSDGTDIIFNYGTFDFHTPHFYWKYAKGLLDYQLSIQTFDSFMSSYKADGRSVYFQKLNLSSNEKTKLISLLKENYKEENRYYKYNFLFDNCTTRARDIIEGSLSSPINWSLEEDGKRYWNQLDEYLQASPWVQFGIHTILGQRGNRHPDIKKHMFLPDYLMQGLKDADCATKLVSEQGFLYKAPIRKDVTYWYTKPYFVLSVIAAFFIILLQFYKKKYLLECVTAVLFTATGLLGCLIVFLGAFTEHPITAPNYNILWAMPLNLLIIPTLFIKKTRVWKQWYTLLYAIILLVAFILWFFLTPATSYSTLPIIVLLMYVSIRLYIREIKK